MNEKELKESVQETDKIFERFEEREKEGERDIFKYTDRIHDKLFAFNSMLIAGYFVLITFPNISINSWWFVLPISNMLLSIYIENRMLNDSHFRASLMDKCVIDFNKRAFRRDFTTLLSFFSRGVTTVTALAFIYQVISVKPHKEEPNMSYIKQLDGIQNEIKNISQKIESINSKQFEISTILENIEATKRDSVKQICTVN